MNAAGLTRHASRNELGRHAQAWQAVEDFLAAIGHPLPNSLPRREWLSAFGIILASLSEDEKRWLARKLFSVTRREPKARRLWAFDDYEAQWPTRAQAALTRVFKSLPLDPAYAAHKRESEKRFSAMLLSDPRVLEAYRNWNSYYDLEKKKEFLVYFAALQDKAFSHETFQFTPPREFIFTSMGYDADYRAGAVRICPNERFDDFVLACRNMAHEKSHDHQNQLAVACRAGRIPRHSPFYNQARLFADYFTPSGKPELYIPQTQYHRGYMRHPVERDARSTHAVVYFLNLKLDMREKRKLWRVRFQAAAGLARKIMPVRGAAAAKTLPAPQAAL